MCLLIYASPGSTPTKKALRTAGANNPDGFGFAFAIGHRIVRHRSMNLDETVELFHEMRAEHPMAHAIFHLRITTHGATDINNCHPFMVDDGIVLGHNGMLPIKEVDGKSDTRQFAEEWLPNLGVKEVLDNPVEFAELEKFARGSKLAVLSVNPMLDKPVYLVNEQDGHWDKGVWYSNNSYKYVWYTLPTKYSSSTTYVNLPDDDDLFEKDSRFWYDNDRDEMYVWHDKHGWMLHDDDEDTVPMWCAECLSSLTDQPLVEDQYCWDCGQCVACDQPYDNCFCRGYYKSKR